MKIYTEWETLVKGDVTKSQDGWFVVSANGKNERGYWHEVIGIEKAYQSLKARMERSEQERLQALCRLEEARATIKNLNRKIQIGNYDESYVYELQRKSEKLDCLSAALIDLLEDYDFTDTQGE